MNFINRIFSKSCIINNNSNNIGNSNNSTIIINGKTYNGRNVVCKNNKVYVDGKDMTPEQKEIKIIVNGNCDVLEVEAGHVEINGNVTKEVSTGAGDIKITGDVVGDISSGAGDIKIGGSVTGEVSTGAGDINCDRINKQQGEIE